MEAWGNELSDCNPTVAYCRASWKYIKGYIKG